MLKSPQYDIAPNQKAAKRERKVEAKVAAKLGALRQAAEWGYRQREKGMSLDAMFVAFDALMKATRQ